VVRDSSCVTYPIDSEGKTIELYISKREFASLNYRVLVCGNMLANASVVKSLEITPDIVTRLCANSEESKKLSIVWSVATNNVGKEEKSVKVDLLAQYKGGVVVLAEGVSYSRIATVQEGQYLARFAFNLVILSQIRGRFKVFAKLASQSFKETDSISNINYHFASSQTLDYSQ
jgi:hypothetical protein